MYKLLATATALLLTMQVGAAQAGQDPCAQYYGKGYCTDYVNRKIGERIRGDADTWRSNISPSQVQAGDVAIFRSRKHVAFVERVTQRDSNRRPTHIEVSEMNWGTRDPQAPRECFVTVNFNRTTRRTISISGLEFYRPRNMMSKPRSLNIPDSDPGQTANSTPMFPPKP